MKRLGLNILAVAGIGIAMSSCIKKKEFPIEPIITFKSFEIIGDSAYLTFSFTDGDGDIGKSTDDTLAPYTDRFRKSLWFEYYELESGTWVHKPMFNTAPDYLLDYHVPVLNEDEDPKSLQGDILIVMENYYDLSNTNPFKYEIKLWDRALHESNVIETGAIAKP